MTGTCFKRRLKYFWFLFDGHLRSMSEKFWKVKFPQTFNVSETDQGLLKFNKKHFRTSSHSPKFEIKKKIQLHLFKLWGNSTFL